MARLNDGVTQEQFLGALQEVNLMKLSDGKTIDMELDLTAGEYIAICHIPNPATGKAHEELGIVLPFTVKE